MEHHDVTAGHQPLAMNPMGGMPWMIPQQMAPMAAAPTASQLSPQFFSHLYQTLQTIESNLPVDQVMHAFHIQARLDPAVKALPAMARFDAVGDDNLHAKMAVAGFIRRILTGDRSPEVMLGLQDQLRVLQQTHGEMRTAITQLMSADVGNANGAVKALSQVMPMADQVHKSVMPMLQPMLNIEVRVAGDAREGQ